ncbi:DNA repair protein rad16 [Trapelia coarctata]|nr:DNA repair protein rad16 [Trapelia coarctata]
MPRGRKKAEPGSNRASLSTALQTNAVAAPEPSPAPARQRGRLPLASKKNTDVDMEMSPDNLAEFASPHVSSSATKVLKEVAIPMRRAAGLGHRAPSPSLSTSSSALSQYHEYSNEYETPETSAVATPAESIFRGRRTSLLTNHKKHTPSAGRTTTNAPSLLGGKGKRKRTKEDDEEEDFLFAQSLQAEEYGATETTRVTLEPRGRGRSQRFTVPDSEDEGEDHISFDAEFNFFTRNSTLRAESGKGKRAKLPSDSFLPSRAARDSAKKSIAKSSSLAVPGTDDDDDLELSEYESDLEFEEEDVEFDEDADLVETDAAGVTLPSTDASGTQPAPHRRPRGSRVTGLRTSASNSRNFGTQGWTRADDERKKLERAHPEIKTLWTDLEAIPTITPIPAQQPEAILRSLKVFQLEGLDWMCKQEQSKWKGGLLGDEMGMGKTIQAVSLIMSDYPTHDPTLVVVPPVALMQWRNEINEYTNGKLNILIHHNTDPKVKNLTLKQLKAYDVIMISYSGLESIYRKQSKGWKKGDDLVKENSKIHAIRFHRLILDEAHNIKSRETGVAKACFAISAEYRWCLSGTPVQNRIGEFFSLLRFLQVKPFACYFCKMCDCAQLHLSKDVEMKCTHCKHTGFQHVSVFNQELLNPITQGEDPELRKAALRKLKLLTDRIMLRRMKRDHTASMELPPKEVIIHNEFFGPIERDFSSSIMTKSNRQFDTYVARGVFLHNYANIFGLIMQMRQVANHPDLILKKHAQQGQNVLVCSICDETAEEPIRSRCHHEFCRKCVKDYVRSFDEDKADPQCPRCHIELEVDFDQPDIEQDEDTVKKNSIINRIKMEDWTSSTKIEMLIYDLYKLRSKKQTHKSIVFSQFTSMLQLVEWRLHRAGFSTVMLDGSMSPVQREKSIAYFMKNPEVEVFLVSLKAGGVALNLTEASRVFIIDPWWNPAAEWQSADRCHRIGQKRPCVITRLCIEDSVESRMVLLQEKKANMINGTINNDTVAMEKLSPEDMEFLFRGS